MSTAIMQQLHVFLEGDLPGMLALFLCGIVGWAITKHVNGRCTTLAKIQAKTKSIDAEHDDEIASAPKSNKKTRKRSSRLSKEDSSSPLEGSTVEVEPECVPTAVSTDVTDDVVPPAPTASQALSTTKSESELLASPTEVNHGRVAKIMAKKAERKARKLQEQRPLQAGQEDKQDQTTDGVSAEAEPQVPTNIDQDEHCNVTADEEEHISCDSQFALQKASTTTSGDSGKLMPYGTAESTASEDVHCDPKSDEEEQASCDSETSHQKASPSGLSGKLTSCGASDSDVEATPSEDDVDVDSVCTGYSTSEDIWAFGQACVQQVPEVQSQTQVCTHVADDGWMNSFDDMPDPANEPSVPADQPASFVNIDASTGNEVHFEPVQQNNDGTMLYSDGQQLYQAVCVRVEDLVPSDTGFQISLSPETAFQNLPADIAPFQTVSSDGNFQQLSSPTTLQQQASDVSFAVADGSCFQQVSLSDSMEDMQFYEYCLDGSLQCPMTPADVSNGCVFDVNNHQDLYVSSKMVSPTFQDDAEDEAWNTCWDFAPSAWSK